MFSAIMGGRVLLLLAFLFYTHLFSVEAHSTRSSSQITVMGAVYCDICSNNTFSRQSYFLSGVNVHISCKFKANSPTTTEQITFSVNRTTDKHGIYKLVIPSIEDVECTEGLTIQSFCQASLIGGAAASSCSVPGLKTTSDVISIKSKQANLCFYSLNALNYRPSKRDITLCGESKGMSNSFNSSKFFFPYCPPFGFPWPHFPQFPPFPKLPFPPLPPFPYWPFPNPSSPPPLPFPFPQLPPLPPTPSLLFPSPSPPAFSLRDPRTWIPYYPPSPPQFQKNQQP
ncbi:hypothetical protein GIB67_041822 [Kingdonia uniflora]|uniref:Pollen Ole e 1 allergen and extensin family protein n=1 Tax=Kingdonia uniflora TaxID=39325 RepID=A0A7J7L5W1_9MAGN|nr:hypothetical protein GIB67_041822 [Kingdonia uniflora]